MKSHYLTDLQDGFQVRREAYIYTRLFVHSGNWQ